LEIAQNCEPKLSKATFATGCVTQMRTCIGADFASSCAHVQAPAPDLENKSWKELQEKSGTQIL
jgi:hypothetical protein